MDLFFDGIAERDGDRSHPESLASGIGHLHDDLAELERLARLSNSKK